MLVVKMPLHLWLQYLSKLKKDKKIIVMDSDGEDNPDV